jgi:hypothetical protein
MSCRAGGLQPSVEGHEFGGELLCQRQIGGIIAAQAERLGQPEGICMVDLENLDRHPSVKGECSQQRLALLRAAAELFETDAGDFEAQQDGRHEMSVLQPVGDGFRFRLAPRNSP